MVDVDLSVARLPANDRLGETIDYATVADLVIEIVESGPYQLIETLANEIASRILASEPLAEGVRVTVHKPEAPLAQPFSDVAVSIIRSR